MNSIISKMQTNNKFTEFIEDIKNIVSKKFREKFLSNIQLVISRKEEKVINKIELIKKVRYVYRAYQTCIEHN